MNKILFVDDEKQILKALVRVFRHTEYEVITAESGVEGLSLLKENEVDMVVSDMRMPNMNGYVFLSKVKEQYPHVMRVILSGYSDESIVMKALNMNIAKLYMFKPWNNDELLNVINQMFETEKLLDGTKILEMINNTENVPTIKQNYKDILREIDDDSDIEYIAQLIERDVSIATNILHVANSAYYGANTSSIKNAIVHLGLKNTRNLIISTSIIDAMDEIGIVGNYIRESWNHAFISNRLIKRIYKILLKKRMPEDFQSVGLVINVGKVFMLKYYKKEYLNLYRNAKSGQENLIKEEKNLFNITRDELGAYLLKWWDFSFPIVETTLYHNDPFNKNIVNKEIIYVTHLAAGFVHKMMGNENLVEIDLRVIEELKLTYNEVEKVIEEFTKEHKPDVH